MGTPHNELTDGIVEDSPRAIASIDDEVHGLRLLLAIAAEPLPLDELADVGIWRPGALLRATDTLRTEGMVEFVEGSRCLHWQRERDTVVGSASDQDFSLLTGVASCLPWLLGGAQLARAERRFRTAGTLYRQLAQIDSSLRTAFPGGPYAWVSMVVEATRLLRADWDVSPAVLDVALTLCEAQGDLASQAVLLAARGVRFLPGDVTSARDNFDRSLEAAEAVDSVALRTEVRLYIATSLTLSGRPGEGIAAFESLIGDMQADLLDPASALLLDLESAVPASPVSMLALAYASVGEHPRAIDIIQRVIEIGASLGNAALEAQGKAMLAVVCMYAGYRAGAARWAEAAMPWFASVTSPYTWACTVALAWSRAAAHPQDAHALIAGALPTWHKTGRHWVGGSRMLELLQLFEDSKLPALDGLSIREEVTRHINNSLPFFAGIAHRWAAMPVADQPSAAVHLTQSVRLLREAGGGPELGLALKDSCENARKNHEDRKARALYAELAGHSGLPASTSKNLRLGSAVLELGRLESQPLPEVGLWRSVVTQLCRDFGGERCAIVTRDDDGQQQLRAARGSPRWCEAVLTRTLHPLSAPVFETALAPGYSDRAGQLVLVPFDDGSKYRGVIAIENRDTTPQVSPEDMPLLVMLGQQMAIVLGNVERWRQVVEVRRELEEENQYYRETTPKAREGHIEGQSAAMRTVADLIHRVAPTTTPVLITGETGVGKELTARELHDASRRRSGPFITVHIAALAPGLVASALFGQERGAFTGAVRQTKGRFELAHHGTIFLDEVAELSVDDQVRLLRVLQDGTLERVGGTRALCSDFRLVAATNRNLLAEVQAGRFREDLYYRLAAFPIHVPPLRERLDELPTLARSFVEKISRKLGVQFAELSPSDLERLRQYHWPGNIRELQHFMERAVLLSDPPRLRIPPLDDDKQTHAVDAHFGTPLAHSTHKCRPLQEDWVSLEEMQRRYVQRVLHHVHGRISGPGGAAELLQLKPTTLQFWLDRLGLRQELARARESRGTKPRPARS